MSAALRPDAAAIRDARLQDWPQIWPFFHRIVAGGETFAYDREMEEPEAQQFNSVVGTNERAIALWRSLGFVALAAVPVAFEDPTKGLVELLIMHRFL